MADCSDTFSVVADRGDKEQSGFVPGTLGWWSWYRQMRSPYDQAAEELKGGDGSSLAIALRFLTERPRFLQSGYIAERMLRYIDRVALSPKDRARVVAVATPIAAEGWTREAREAKRLLVRLEAAN
jgi:hypothetical protein